MDAVVIGAENSHPAKTLLAESERPSSAVLSAKRHGGKPPKKAGFADQGMSAIVIEYLAKIRSLSLFLFYISGWRRGLRMNRFSAAAAILIYLFLIAPQPATAQSDQGCFPWQEFRDGRCVAKPSEALPPPALPPPPAVTEQCRSGSRNLSAQCTCPANTHFDRPSGMCVADATPAAPLPPPPLAPSPPLAPAPATALAPQPPAPPPPPAVAPAPPPLPAPSQAVFCDGGNVIDGACACPAGFHVMAISGVAVGGRCVKTDAENCLGGELTVSGVCQCNGEVRMSGDVYLLEFVKGKCIPKRCPVQTVLKDGKCLTNSAVTTPPEPEETGKVPPVTEAKKEPEAKDSDDDDHHRHCARGMVHNRSGDCVAARRRAPNSALAKQYLRMYQGWGN